jgi:hypothetical protein
VGVHRFIDAMLAESYPAEERSRFVAGLGDVDALAQGECGRPFLQCAAAEQRSLLDQLDREAFASAPREAPPPTHNPTRPPFFRTMKELVVVGYYTSEIGATRELRHVAVPGRFEGCVPFPPNGRTWAV